jgi:Tfp pilus assembly protein PilF
MRMNDLRRQVFLILVSLANPIDGRCIGDACQAVGLQHVEFQSGLDETYFATVTDRGATYDFEIIDLAKQFFRKQVLKLDSVGQDEIKRLAAKVDKQTVRREELDRAYVHDRVADAFRSQYAKAAKIAVDRGDYVGADESFKLAMLEEPMNSALKDRYAWFLSHILQRLGDALPYAIEAVQLDPKSGDARITLGLIEYRLGDIESGDASMDHAIENGKPQMLCYLRMGIARYHQAKKIPYSRDAINLLKEADVLLQRAEKAGTFDDDYYYYKNLHDIRRYNSLVAALRSGINRRDVSSKDAPGETFAARGNSSTGAGVE